MHKHIDTNPSLMLYRGQTSSYLGGAILEPVVRLPVTDAVVQRIVEYIRSAKLGPGDKLPSEKDFLSCLQVSRPSLREALRSLAATGVIEMQPGLGTFVAKPSLVALLAHGPLPSLLATTEDVREFVEARKALEPELVALAASRATPSDMAAMESALERVEQTLQAGEPDDGPLLDFHTALFESAHNRILLEMALPIICLLSEVIEHLDLARPAQLGPDYLQERVNSHRKLLAAVRSGDGDAARSAALDHIYDSYRKLLSAMEDSPKEPAKESDHQFVAGLSARA